MDTNIVRDITDIYFGQIVESVDQDSDGDNDFADVRIARMIASGVPKEVAIKKTRNKKYNKKIQIAQEELVGNQHRIDANNNKKIDADDFKILRSKGKTKKIKEGFSNWRNDLCEVIDKIEKSQKVVEKKVENKVTINPSIDLGDGVREGIERLGGTLIEMNEIEDFDCVFDDLSESEVFLLKDDLIEKIVEEVFIECIEEGYDVFEIENVLIESIETSTAILTEAKVTYGHDTNIKTDRLEKVKSAVKKVGKGIAHGAGYAAGLAVRGVKAVGRELKRGYQRGRYGSGETTGTSTSSSSGSSESGGQSGSSESDGRSQASGSSKPGLLGKIGSKLKSGLKKVIAKGARVVSRGARNVARKMEGNKPAEAKPQTTTVKSSTTSTQSKTAAKPPIKTSVNLDRPGGSMTYRGTGYERGSVSLKGPKQKSQAQSQTQQAAPKPQAKTTTVSAKPSSGEDKKKRAQALRLVRRNPNISPEDIKRAVGEEYEVNEKTLTASETKEKERLVKSMKDKAADFEKRYPGRGKEVMYATATKISKKIAEQNYEYVDEAKLPSSMKKGKKKLESKTQVIHDVDDNLADQRHPDAAKIDLMRKSSGKWKRVKSLTPSQFAHHKLRGPGEPIKEEKDDPGDKYGFDQFRSTKKFKETTKPNKPVVRLGDSPKRPAQKSVVTARGGSEFGSEKPSTPMDKPGEFAKDLKTRIGVKNLERKNVHFTGGMRKGSGPEKKAEVVKKIVKPDAKKVITTDDHLQNVRHMAAAASSVAPKAKVRAYQSKPATKAKGKVKSGDIVPVRVGKEKNLSDPNIGIRKNTSPSSSTKETQRRRKTARRGMGEAVDVNAQQQTTSPTQVQQAQMQKPDPRAKQIQQRDLQNKKNLLRSKMNALSKGAPDIDV